MLLEGHQENIPFWLIVRVYSNEMLQSCFVLSHRLGISEPGNLGVIPNYCLHFPYDMKIKCRTYNFRIVHSISQIRTISVAFPATESRNVYDNGMQRMWCGGVCACVFKQHIETEISTFSNEKYSRFQLSLNALSLSIAASSGCAV